MQIIKNKKNTTHKGTRQAKQRDVTELIEVLLLYDGPSSRFK